MDWLPVYSETGSDFRVLYWSFNHAIQKPEGDATDYRIIRLSNGVQALLCSDPQAASSGASVIAHSGSYDQPVCRADIPGLAHLVEHCVHRYMTHYARMPNQQGSLETLEECLRRHGNSAFIAKTETDRTMFSFQVSPSGLQDSLQHLSSIFAPPQITSEDLQHEVLSVHAEFQRMHARDNHRESHLNQFLSRPDASCVRFFEGSYQSIVAQFRGDGSSIHPGPDEDGGNRSDIQWTLLRQRMLDWWSSKYLIRPPVVVVIGRESLNELSTAIFDSLSNAPYQRFPTQIEANVKPVFKSPWTAEHEGTVVYIQSVQGYRFMNIRWVVPWCAASDETKFTRMFACVMLLRGPGSMFTVMREKGWANNFHVVPNTPGNSAEGYDYFIIMIGLTEEGCANWRSVAHLVQDFMDLFQTRTVAPQFYEEVIRMAEVGTQFSQKEPTIERMENLATGFIDPHARHDVPLSPWLYFHHDPVELQAYIYEHLRLQKARIIIGAHSETDWQRIGLSVDVKWEVAPYYGTKYTVDRLDLHTSETSTQTRSGSHDLRLPQSNPFTPKDCSVLSCIPQFTENPVALTQSPGKVLWFKKDNDYALPWGCIYYQLCSRAFVSDVKAQVCFGLLTRMVYAELCDTLYNATLVSLFATVEFSSATGLMIRAKGYNDKLQSLFFSVVDAICDFRIIEKRVEDCIHELREDLRYQHYMGIERQSALIDPDTLTTELLYRHSCSPQALLDGLEGVTKADVHHYTQGFLQSSELKLLVYGNFRQEEALVIEGACCERLPVRNYEKSTSCDDWMHPLTGRNYILEIPRRQAQTSSQISYLCEVCKVHDVKSGLKLMLIADLMQQELHSKLLDAYDLGYYVDFKTSTAGGKMWLAITMETSHDPAYAEQCIEQFLEDIQTILEHMPGDKFDERKAALQDRIKSPVDHDFNSEARRLIRMVTENEGRPFVESVEKCRALEAMTVTEVADLFRMYLSPRSSCQRKVSVRLSAERKLSAGAAEMLLKQLSPHVVPTTASELPSILRHDLSLSDAIKACRDALPDTFDDTHVENEVRNAAELYPWTANNPTASATTGTASDALEVVEAPICRGPFVFFSSIEGFRTYLDVKLD